MVPLPYTIIWYFTYKFIDYIILKFNANLIAVLMYFILFLCSKSVFFFYGHNHLLNKCGVFCMFYLFISYKNLLGFCWCYFYFLFSIPLFFIFFFKKKLQGYKKQLFIIDNIIVSFCNIYG